MCRNRGIHLLLLSIFCLVITASVAAADPYTECIVGLVDTLAECKAANDQRLQRAQATNARCNSDAGSARDRRDRQCRRDYPNNPTRLEECLTGSAGHQDVAACAGALTAAVEQHRIDGQACDSAHDECVVRNRE